MEGSQKRGGGGMVPISPLQTPRSSDKAVRDQRSGEGSFSGKHDKDRGVNVQVIVRCRPLSEDEARLHTPVVISCNDSKREVCAVQNIANKQIDRTFQFDKVFGPSSQQKDLYHQAVSPIVFEVLEGYTSTIFAYGQTGTVERPILWRVDQEKRFDMESPNFKAPMLLHFPIRFLDPTFLIVQNGDIPSDAGVIPRAVRQIFDILEAQHAEYSIKVTFLELYNEEITDLLAPEECSKFIDDKSKKPMALMEDGKGGVFVRGLEEEIVTTADEIYKILEKGSSKRRTAETLLNKQSSRSHSVFSITIHIKECTPEGEEMIKCGKLNLVDLAGSENISRSGAREGRAREAGEINKSLLTLGRVINALVEHSGHIPYRDSKLTRLLRDSLGGKTKTCIIATISPSIHCLEETLSTLDYAHRAKNIKNKPEVNQKMMKSALIKDLYFEIDRLKQEVHAAREKNGIYVPKDRYLQDEAEKKAMSEKIEHMEIDIETKDKQLLELQELYNSQQLLSVQLSEKLENSEKKLQETECTLLDLEERHRQANATIKEKDFLISNLLKSEKALTEHALGLRAELENAASDLSDLFAKIERKDKIEDSNRVLIQKFQSQLTQQLEILHKAVASATTQQEHHLKAMEEDMHLFVSSKAEATEELRDHLEKLASMYGSGIKVLHDLAGELDNNSQSTFGDLNAEVSKHSSVLEKLFKEIATEANSTLHDLQESLHSQETKLTTYAQQQREAHSRAVETARSISHITANFFKTVDGHTSTLGQIVEEAQTINDHKLFDLEKKFEECAAAEERQLLAEVAELLAGSNARKKKLVQCAIDELRESASSRTNKLQQEMSIMQNTTSSIKADWTSYSQKAESHYLENTALVESGKKEMKDVIQNCSDQAKLGAQQWNNAQDALLALEKRNVASVDEIVRGGIDAIEGLRGRYSSAVSSALENAEVGSKNMLSSIDRSLQLDHEACGTVDSIVSPCCEDLRQLNSGHHHKIAEITDNAGKCLLEDYKVDRASCSTPKKRLMNIPSIASIENLKTPSFEELVKSSFSGAKLSKQENGEVKNISDALSSREHRLPFTAIN